MPGFQVVGDVGPALPRRPRRPVSLSPKAAADLFCSEQVAGVHSGAVMVRNRYGQTPVIRSCPPVKPVSTVDPQAAPALPSHGNGAPAGAATAP